MKGTAKAISREMEDTNALVERHAPLVKRIAYHLSGRLPPSVQVDDLMQAGMLGLLDAARNYDATQGASFETYAGIRIHGSMLDEIRRSDWTPRSVHRKAREVAAAVREVEHRTGREARDVEVAEELGMELDRYHQVLQDATCSRVFSLEEVFNADSDDSEDALGEVSGPFAELQQDGFRDALIGAIEGLPERERLVMALYYDEELNLREIGTVLGVSESRVCQIHGQALTRLRARLADWVGGEAA